MGQSRDKESAAHGWRVQAKDDAGYQAEDSRTGSFLHSKHRCIYLSTSDSRGTSVNYSLSLRAYANPNGE